MIAGDRTAEARAAFRRDPEWVAPLLWRSEFRNVLAAYFRRDLALEDGLQLAKEAERLMEGGEYHVDSPRVLSLAAVSPCSAYDCEFVALAQELGIPLVTSDREILRAFPTTAVALNQFT